MKRVLIGKYMDQYFTGSEDQATKLYTHPEEKWQIWEVEDSMYGYMCEQSEEDFAIQAGDNAFWRSAEGTVLGKPTVTAEIHDSKLLVWELYGYEYDYKFNSLLDYLYHLGITKEVNLIAAFKDLAKYNKLPIQDLLDYFEAANYER